MARSEGVERAERELVGRAEIEGALKSGNIALHGAEKKVHAHIVLGKADGTAHGGHLIEGRVRPTLEVVVVESPGWLQREHDEKTGLPLLSPGA